MAKLYWEKDTNPDTLNGKRIAILGYGSQGKAHANNLRESDLDVVLGLRPGGRTWSAACKDGWEPKTAEEAVTGADVVAFLVPDMAQPKLYRDAVEPNMKKGVTLMFAHGFNIHYGSITPPEDVAVALVAPKSPGALVRSQYQEGRGVPCLIAAHGQQQEKSFATALAYAHGLGGTRAGVLKTTFGEETETDLFGEQAVLCGGVTELVMLGFETLVGAGYQPEVAYFECMHELKLIVDLLYEGGFARMHEFVSETAKWGDLTSGPRVIDDSVRKNMKQILTEIQDGTFAREWKEENEAGLPRYKQLLETDMAHQIEKVGSELRGHMSWLSSAKENKEEALV